MKGLCTFLWLTIRVPSPLTLSLYLPRPYLSFNPFPFGHYLTNSILLDYSYSFFFSFSFNFNPSSLLSPLYILITTCLYITSNLAPPRTDFDITFGHPNHLYDASLHLIDSPLRHLGTRWPIPPVTLTNPTRTQNANTRLPKSRSAH